MNKKITLALSFLAVIVLLVTGCAQKNSSASDDSLKKVKDKKELVVATSGTLFPSSYYNDDNKLTGYDVEVVKEVAKRMGVKAKFKEYNVDGQIASLEKGEADINANDSNLNKERAKKFIISTPIKHSFDSLIVRKSDDSGIHSLEDLKGKKAAGEPNTGYMKIAKQYGAQLVTYDNATNDQYLTDVANGRTDVILNDYYLQKMSVEALPKIPVKILKDVYFNAETSGLLMKKQNKALKTEVDKQLKEMKADGTLTKISKKFFTDDVSVKPKYKIQKTVEIKDTND
ncbi:transporter substrate-binding domain-containing protein [Companilactobacillus nodensis]|uniref:ABC transporter periplasmic protein n=1 Tax=Companilactobacillus nodensis DSM 19682 = JCM 14932 = NBRC 107160 TaxID=1423775 RepID=A0A0R1KD73_9LACO|nr:transporter substrate-binding domain-containing protein [Companilactobacillus nodensis]KRK81307.1 ABC transporter periplasmic protein [Companilactobacillus nodensis DSM 19682 = JCM 14932 = NBRC 107160]